VASLDARGVAGDLLVRSRRAGDRFHPLGMKTDKKLQDFFVDHKVPREWRDRVPLLVAGGRIAWVVGYRVAEWARTTPDSRSVLRVEFFTT
jgi:tRNA(Ile)-lysidine synthase